MHSSTTLPTGKECANCGTSFKIAQEDLDFYDKVSQVFGGKKYQISPPSLCPDCRQQRRLTWRNERNLMKRKCDLCDKEILAIYPMTAPFPVYCNQCWWSDKWDAKEFGRDFGSSKPFLEQFHALQDEVPRNALYLKNAQNSDYCNHSDSPKNCYMTICTAESESVFYSKWVIKSRDICDCYRVEDNELCYESLYCYKNYRCIYCYISNENQDCALLFDCTGCSNCFLCCNLRHKQYCIENVQYSKEDYEKEIGNIDLSSNKQFKHWKSKYIDMLINKAIHQDQRLYQCQDCQGNLLSRCKNVRHSYDVLGGEDCKYTYDAENIKDCMDVYEPAFNCELQYDSHACNRGIHTLFAHVSYDVSDVIYADSCHNSTDLFGCVGIRRGQYCILNKQYSKEEYERLVPKIIEHMQSTGEWGEFFPVSLSPFAYNETVAQEYFPMAKEEVLAKGWKWRDEEDEIPEVEKTIPAEQLPDNIEDIPDDILNWAIECKATGRPFLIVKQELNFYRRMKLPIPHLHPDERHKRRLALRNPRKLWDRTCNKCSKAIQTTYAPDRPEMVYCESCYLNEVY